MIATPVLVLAGQLALWGPGNFGWDAVLPLAAAGLVFGMLQRVPE